MPTYIYVHKVSMMVDHCTQYKQNPLIHLRYITINIQNLWNNWHKCYILVQSQNIFYMHQSSIMVDYGTKYEQNQLILFCDIATNIKFKKTIAIITQICHRSKWYFTCTSNTLYLITVPNMNKINSCFSEISHQIHKMYEKVTIITQIWHRARYCISMSNAWYLIIVTKMNNITTFGRTDRQTDWTLSYIP